MSPRKRLERDTDRELRSLRESQGLSQAELGQLTGYSEKTIRRWEAGETRPRRLVMEFLRSQQYLPDNATASSFSFVDLFAGIGGLRRGFEGLGGRCVFTSEWDKYAQQTYRANFSTDHPIAGDIVQIASELIPSHDVLLAGFPCQPFSIAGISKKNSLGRPHGFACDAQGTMFFEVARILRYHRPAAFLLENVKNLASHDGGRTFRVIKQILTEELGYNISWKIIDGRSFVPQHRERIYIVGFRDRSDFEWNSVEIPPPGAGPRLSSILHPEDGTEKPEQPYLDPTGKVASRYQLSKHLWQYLQDYAAKHREKGNGFGFGLVGPNDIARTLSARYYKDGSEILVKRQRGTPRRLTPRECARLMGFDKPGQSDFRIPVSDTQSYKQFGNSVVVPVVQAIASAMVPLVLGKPAVQADQYSLQLKSRRS
jgi:DNA (cytosine-5)-methyltransferase 1